MSQPSTTTPASTGENTDAVEQASAVADATYRAAAKAGEANSEALLRVAALELRALFPAAHTLLVNIESWAAGRGGSRPDIRAVRDEYGRDLWDEGETSSEGVGLTDAVIDVCTSLNEALQFCDPWNAPGWDGVEGKYGPTYAVALPAPGTEQAERSLVTIDTCRCVESCADDPATRCSLSGEPHVHPDDGTGTFGRCTVHPDAPGDL